VSFLLDPPALYASGEAYARLAPEAQRERGARPFALAALALFWGVSVPLYLDARWTRPLWRLVRARSGRDWMLNSGVLRLDPGRAGPRTHALAAGIFATYPAWLALGYRRGRRARLAHG
jgi:hypothetical protein